MLASVFTYGEHFSVNIVDLLSNFSVLLTILYKEKLKILMKPFPIDEIARKLKRNDPKTVLYHQNAISEIAYETDSAERDADNNLRRTNASG